MLRILDNSGSLQAQRTLSNNILNMNNSLKRLSTGLRINSGKDDPAGLIAGEHLRAEIAGLESAYRNAERADHMLSVADGGLTEVSGLLAELKGLVVASGNSLMSDAERHANQMQIDSILSSVNRIAGGTQIAGERLLDGSKGYYVSEVDAGVEDYAVYSAASVGPGGLPINVAVTQAAEQGSLFMEVDDGSGAPAGDNSLQVTVTGANGSVDLTFAAGTSQAAMATTINQHSAQTGVTAAVHTEGGMTGLMFTSDEYGSAQSVAVAVTDDGGRNGGVYQLDSAGAVDVATGQMLADLEGQAAVSDVGVDVAGTVNGVAADGSGRTLTVNSGGLDMTMTLDAATAGAVGSLTAMRIDGGGMTFQLGSQVGVSNQLQMGLPGVSTGSLGRGGGYSLADLAGGGSLNVVNGDVSQADAAVSRAINQVATYRGRIGAVQKNTLAPTMNSLGVAIANTAGANSMIRDTDFARETAYLNQNHILVQAGRSALALANSVPANALSLLG